MSESNQHNSAEGEQPRVRVVDDGSSAPVYNCQALVAPRNNAGVVVARAANLPQVAGEGQSEREALQALVAAFKKAVADYAAREEAIPWREPPLPAAPGETARFIAVHL